MKKYILIVFLLNLCLPSIAQNKQSKDSEEKFREKKEAYITKKAELSPEEAAQFFPLYFEWQDKKTENNRNAWVKGKTGLKPNTTEEEYEEIFNAFFKADKDNCALDREYLEKSKKFLSNKKIYMILKAEMLFSRYMLKIAQEKDEEKK